MSKVAKILLVEDDLFLRDLLMQKLEREGFDVVSTGDGTEVLRKAEKYEPDLILLDLCLPKQSGFDSLEKIRAHDQLREKPVIIISNLDSDEDRHRAAKNGISGYIVKSKTAQDDIVKQVREALL